MTHVCCAIVVLLGESACSGSLLRDLQEAVGLCGLRVHPLGKAVTCVEQVLCDSAAIPSRKKAHSEGHSRTAARATCTTTSRVSLTLTLPHSPSLSITLLLRLWHTTRERSVTRTLCHVCVMSTGAQPTLKSSGSRVRAQRILAPFLHFRWTTSCSPTLRAR